jgi:single-strand DNA-binding protein
MSSYNKIILMGNLTRDPQLRYLPSGMAVCDFGLAVNHRWRDKDGNQREEVCFVDCSCFAKGGEIINQYMTKGKGILVDGRLKLDTWTAQDGQKRSKHTVVVENFQFVGGRGEGGQGAPAGSGGESYAPRDPARLPERRAPAPAPEPANGPAYEPEPSPPSGDEIPF